MPAPLAHYNRRKIILFFGRFIRAALARVTVSGYANIPKRGPLIIVGNHVGYAEPTLMATTMPWPIELVAGGDVPIRSNFAWMLKLYGALSVNRGEIDRNALKSISDILERGGSVGIFPEGGVWDRKIGDARLGVAYISQQTQTPILPMGFGGVVGALDKAFKFQRPKVTVNIGKLIPPVPTSENYRERKALAQKASNAIMQSIYDLVPPDDEINKLGERQEAFDLVIELTDAAGAQVAIPDEMTIANGDDVALLFHRPILLGVVIDNLERPAAEPLRHLQTERDPAKFAIALGEALQVYSVEKPVFLGYRLGYQRAERILASLRKMKALADWAAGRGCQMNIMPKVTITYPDGRIEHANYPAAAHHV